MPICFRAFSGKYRQEGSRPCFTKSGGRTFSWKHREKTVLSWLETVRSGATRVDLEQVRRLSGFSKELVELLRLFALQDRDSFWMLCSVAGGGKPAFRVENRRNAFSARLRENTVLLSRFGIELHIANDFPFVLNRESTKSIFSNPSVVERMRAFFRDTGNARDVERLALDAPMNDSDLNRLLSFWKSLDRFDHRFTFIEGLILGFDLLSVDAFARAYRLEQPPSLPVSPRFVLFLLAGPALYERLSPFLSFKAFRHSFTGALEAGLRSVTGMNNVNRVMKRRFGFDLFRQNPLAAPRVGLDRLADKSA
jgi:hypothetical protein